MKIRKRTVVIVITLVVLVSTVRYFKVKYRGIELSPQEFDTKWDSVYSPNTVNSVRFDGIRDGRVYLFASRMFGFPENFHDWVELENLSPEQRAEIEKFMLQEKVAKEARER